VFGVKSIVVMNTQAEEFRDAVQGRLNDGWSVDPGTVAITRGPGWAGVFFCTMSRDEEAWAMWKKDQERDKDEPDH
jgi:hypothetical protein